MIQFISISSGSSGNCYYLNCNGFGLLIDLGISMRKFRQHFSNYGLSIAQINAILVTHDHTDHVKTVGALSRDFHIPVFTSQLVHDSMMRNHFVSKKVPIDLQKVIERGKPFQLGPFSVTSFTVPHDSADNNGYIIKAEEQIIVLLTDVGHFTEEMETIVSKANHLIIEANYDELMLRTGRYPLRLQQRISNGRGHVCNDATAAFLAKNLTANLIQNIWLCHISAENNTPEKAFYTISNALKQVGYDIDNDSPRLQVLPRRTPTLLMELK